jgi:hypothetical protein
VIDPRRIEVLDPRVAEILRMRTPAERARQASDLYHFARTAIESQLRSLHPDWADEQVYSEMLRRLTGGAA